MSYAGSLDRTIKKVGWCTGAGAEFIRNAKAAGCDLYITGDVKYHAAQEARELDIAVLDCGHFGTEQIFCENIISMLDKIGGVDIIQCDVNLNPFASAAACPAEPFSTAKERFLRSSMLKFSFSFGRITI